MMIGGSIGIKYRKTINKSFHKTYLREIIGEIQDGTPRPFIKDLFLTLQ